MPRNPSVVSPDINPLYSMMDSVSPGFARADFKPELFDTLIKQKGYRVIWEKGMFCSCIDAESGQPDYNCPACHGKGYIYIDPKETRAVITSINGRKDQDRIGLNDQGSAYLTPLSTELVGFRDRFTFCDFTVKLSEVLTKGDDRCRYPVKEICSVMQLKNPYIEGTDFSLSANKLDLIWHNPCLQDGESYSILYTTNPVYIAINPIHELRGTYSMVKGKGLETFIQFPSQYQIKREDLLDNEE